MPKVHANGIDLYYEIHGSGEPLVLISGIGYSGWQWHKMIPGLAEHFQVVSFDNRGSGGTDAPPGPYSARMLADDTAGLMEVLGYESAHVVGHSMGGFIAQELSLSYPDKVRKLVLSATNFGGPRHVPITAEAMAVLSDVTSDPVTRFKRGLEVSTGPGYADSHPDMIEAWLKWRVENPIRPAAYQAQLAVGLALLAEGFEQRLAQVQAPTLILFGEHDKVVPPANAELLAQKIPDRTVKILPDAGHFFPIETPQAANEAIIAFLKA